MLINQQRAQQASSLLQNSTTRQGIFGLPSSFGNSTSSLMLSRVGIVNLDDQSRLEGLDDSIVEISVISDHTSTNDFYCDQPHASCSLKRILAVSGDTPQREKLATNPPLLSMIATEGNWLATTITSKIGRNVKILAKTFTNDDYYLSAATNFPNMPPATMNDELNRNWLCLWIRLDHKWFEQMPVSAKLPRPSCKPWRSQASHHLM